HNSHQDYEAHKMYIYDPWNGLGILTKEAKIDPYIPKKGGRFKQELEGKIQDLVQSLNIIDSKLKGEKTIFVIHGLTQEVKGKTRLLSALRSWAISADLIRKRSLIILLGAAPAALLDEETNDLIANIEVGAGNDSEYE
ncbi:MAG: hypothetical protein GWN31_09745, partial [Candidatus Thorarchaeota archaeon]|nr:hypothetical protein [Candidatus Thorarchaeota archaeon]